MGSFFVVQGSQMNRWLFGGVFKVPPCRRAALPCPTSCAIVMGRTHCMQQSQGAMPGCEYHGSQGADGRTGRLQPPRWNHRQHIRCVCILWLSWACLWRQRHTAGNALLLLQYRNIWTVCA